MNFFQLIDSTYRIRYKESILLSRQKKKRKAKLKKKRQLKRKRGKNTPFTIANCPKKLKGIQNRYEYKINVHHCNFANATFNDVRYRSGHITESAFKQAIFTNIDFITINFKKAKFFNTIFENVVFFSCNLTDVNFKNAHFKNVHFINCKLKNLKFFNTTKEIHIISKYQKPTISSYLSYKILFMKNISKLEKYNILTTTSGDINYWMLNILLTNFTEKQISIFFSKLILNNKQQFFTINDYQRALQKFYQI